MTILEFFLWSLLKVAVVTVVMLLGIAYTVLLERKLVGHIQNRWGPSRVGPFGLLQPLVNGAKSFLKEDLIPTAVYRPIYLLAPILSLGCALVSSAPSSPSAQIWARTASISSKSPTSISGCWSSSASLPWASTALPSPAGLRTTNIPCSVRSALRRSWSATELALGLSLVGVVLRAGSLNLRVIVEQQAALGIATWNIFGGFQFLAFFIYLMAAFAETNRSPFDLPEAESGSPAAITPSISSMKFAMFFMAEYGNMINVGCVATLLFSAAGPAPSAT